MWDTKKKLWVKWIEHKIYPPRQEKMTYCNEKFSYSNKMQTKLTSVLFSNLRTKYYISYSFYFFTVELIIEGRHILLILWKVKSFCAFESSLNWVTVLSQKYCYTNRTQVANHRPFWSMTTLSVLDTSLRIVVVILRNLFVH